MNNNEKKDLNSIISLKFFSTFLLVLFLILTQIKSNVDTTFIKVIAGLYISTKLSSYLFIFSLKFEVILNNTIKQVTLLSYLLYLINRKDLSEENYSSDIISSSGLPI